MKKVRRLDIEIRIMKRRPLKASFDQPMQTTANFLQLDQLVTIAPTNHVQKHVRAQSDTNLNNTSSFCVKFLLIA